MKKYWIIFIVLVVVVSVGSLVTGAEKADMDRIDELVRKASLYNFNNQPDLAIEHYLKAMKDGYRSTYIYDQLGHIYHWKKNDLIKAKEYYKESLNIYPDSRHAYHGLAQIYFVSGELEKGLEHYELSVKNKQGRYRLVTHIDGVLESLEKKGLTQKERIKFFERILDINPNDYPVLQYVADDKRNHKEYEEALPMYMKILELNPRMKMVNRDIGTCYANLNQERKAIDHFQKAKAAGYSVPDEFFEILNQRIKEKESQNLKTPQ